MSRVSNVIIAVPVGEDTAARLWEVNAYFERRKERGFPGDIQELAPDAIGGHKALESALFIGAFNYLDLLDFLRHLAGAVRWDAPDAVQVLVRTEEEELWDLFRLPEQGA